MFHSKYIHTTIRFLFTAPLNSPPPALVCAESSANKTLVRESDAATADLTVQPTSSPLAVQFPDGVIARSTGIAEVALPAKNVTIQAHIFPDNTFNQSLFSIPYIADKGYDVTFNNASVATQYQGAPIYFHEKLPADLFWQLPLKSPVPLEPHINIACIANSTLTLPSDNDFVAIMHSAFGSPSVSTFLRALRRGWLVCAHRPNSIATALGHLAQKR